MGAPFDHESPRAPAPHDGSARAPSFPELFEHRRGHLLCGVAPTPRAFDFRSIGSPAGHRFGGCGRQRASARASRWRWRRQSPCSRSCLGTARKAGVSCGSDSSDEVNAFWPYYLSHHRHRANRAMHDIADILVIGWFACGLREESRPPLHAVVGVGLGYAIVFASHFLIEHNTFRSRSAIPSLLVSPTGACSR